MFITLTNEDFLYSGLIFATLLIACFLNLYFFAKSDDEKDWIYQIFIQLLSSKKEKKFGLKLIKACKKNNLNKAQSLLKENQELNYNLTHYKETALTLACKKGLFNIAELLLDNNTNVNINLLETQKAFKTACKKKFYTTAELILNHISQISFLETLIFSDNTQFIEIILNKQENAFDYQDPYGKTALMHAVFLKDLNVLHFLLQKNANPNLKDLNDCSALAWAFCAKNLKAVDLILDYGGIWKPENNASIDFIRISLKNKRAIRRKLQKKGINPKLFSKILI